VSHGAVSRDVVSGFTQYVGSGFSRTVLTGYNPRGAKEVAP
jgi:hypothetical protein